MTNNLDEYLLFKIRNSRYQYLTDLLKDNPDSPLSKYTMSTNKCYDTREFSLSVAEPYIFKYLNDRDEHGLDIYIEFNLVNGNKYEVKFINTGGLRKFDDGSGKLLKWDELPPVTTSHVYYAMLAKYNNELSLSRSALSELNLNYNEQTKKLISCEKELSRHRKIVEKCDVSHVNAMEKELVDLRLALKYSKYKVPSRNKTLWTHTASTIDIKYAIIDYFKTKEAELYND